MKTINIAKEFRLSENNSIVDLQPGVQEVEDWVAEHWYTKAHCAPLPEPVKPVGPDESPAPKPGNRSGSRGK